MEKFEHEKYRDTLAGHIKEQDKETRKTTLEGAQETDKYQVAELKKRLTEPTLAVIDKYIETSKQIEDLDTKIRTLAGGIADTDLAKYKEQRDSLSKESSWVWMWLGGHRDDKIDINMYTDDNKKQNSLERLLDRQAKQLKEKFGSADVEAFKQYQEHLANQEESLKSEIEKLQTTPQGNETDLKNAIYKLGEIQQFKKYNVLPINHSTVMEGLGK